MIIKTCLLISDDPDDDIQFSEALYEISDDTVLLTVSDINKAIDLLTQKLCVPEFVFLNVNISEFRQETFLEVLQDDSLLKDVSVVVYGDSVSFRSPRITTFLPNDISYSDLKETLKAIIRKKIS